LRTEGKPPLNVRGAQRLCHSRQGDYLAKDYVSISKQVEVVSRFNGNPIEGSKRSHLATHLTETSVADEAILHDLVGNSEVRAVREITGGESQVGNVGLVC
jgi:hypothetical protein